MSLEQQKQQKIGQARGMAFQKLSELVGQGLSPQKAFLQFINTPEGIDFVVNDPDPQAAVSQFLKLATPDPTAQARAEVFGQGRQPQAAASGQPQAGVDIFSGQPAGSAPTVGGTDIFTGQSQQGAVPGMQALPPNVDGAMLRQGAQSLAASGDMEGARLAMELAKQYDALDNPTDLVVVPDAASPTGARLIPKSQAAGLPAFEPRPQVSIEDKRGGKVDEEMSKYYVKRLETEIDEPTKAARDIAPNIQAFRAGLAANNFEPGAAGGFRRLMSQYADLLGIPTDSPSMQWIGLGQPATAELMEGASNLIAESMSGSMSRVSNLSITLLKQAAPELVKTRSGNELLLDLLDTNAQRMQQIGQFKENFIAEAYARGETPNLPQMFGEIEKLRATWKPLDDEFKAKIQQAEKDGNKVTFKGLVQMDNVGMKDSGDLQTFKSEAEAAAAAEKDPTLTDVIINGRRATVRRP
jgi:hypothetical protein